MSFAPLNSGIQSCVRFRISKHKYILYESLILIFNHTFYLKNNIEMKCRLDFEVKQRCFDDNIQSLNDPHRLHTLSPPPPPLTFTSCPCTNQSVRNTATWPNQTCPLFTSSSSNMDPRSHCPISVSGTWPPVRPTCPHSSC